MSTPLLATKLMIPPQRPELVPRPHLLALLDQGLTRKLTLVAAPAGYGKTTVLSEWVHQIDPPAAWLSLARNDNDFFRFITYFLTALKNAQPEIAHLAITPNLSPQIPATELILYPLINELASLDSPAVIVLDDFHLIESDLILRSISFFLDHLPSQVHLVIATRSDPPLPIAKLRGKGELLELREADLRFTKIEISEFLSRMQGLALSEKQVTLLASQTEGWIAGLQLAAISMRERENLDDFIEAFSGSHEYIVDYLTDEVLRGLPDEIKTFLLQTSILDQMCGPLCDAVTGGNDSQMKLEKLRETHIFVIQLDDERHWYRYHALFADHLRKRLQELLPEQVDDLHLSAGEWFEQAGMTTEAIEHTLRGRDFYKAASLIEQFAEEVLMRSEFALFLSWTDLLPVSAINSHPMLGIGRAMSLLMTGNPLDQVDLLLAGLVYETDTHLGGKYVVQATVAVLRGQLSKAYEFAHKAIGLLTADSSQSLRNVALWIISYTSVLETRPSEGHHILKKVHEQSQTSGNEMLTLAASCEMAKLYSFQGKLHQAKRTYEKVLDLARDEQGNLLPIAGEVLIGLGEVLREQNSLEMAEDYLTRGIELTKWGRVATSYRGYISLAKLKLVQGDVVEANQFLAAAKKHAFFEFDQLLTAVEETKCRITMGDLHAAEDWMDSRARTDCSRFQPSNTDIRKHVSKYEELLRARIFLATDRFLDAQTCLATLSQEMEQAERVDILIEIQILDALCLNAQGRLAEACAALDEALSLAKNGDYVRIFLDEGEPLVQLLNRAVSSGTNADYGRKLLRTFSEEHHEHEQLSRYASLVSDIEEPLSDREIQVLH
ncbi:MAG: tetratricopeptide repeat protein, partial [Chloroflexota bacterium]